MNKEQPAQVYLDRRYICTMYPGQFQTISPAAGSNDTPEQGRSLLSQSFTVTVNSTIKLPKAIRRIPICKSRKRFIKKMMALGWKRNRAAAVADMMKRFNGDFSYQQLYWKAFNLVRTKNKSGMEEQNHDRV